MKNSAMKALFRFLPKNTSNSVSSSEGEIWSVISSRYERSSTTAWQLKNGFQMGNHSILCKMELYHTAGSAKMSPSWIGQVIAVAWTQSKAFGRWWRGQVAKDSITTKAELLEKSSKCRIVIDNNWGFYRRKRRLNEILKIHICLLWCVTGLECNYSLLTRWIHYSRILNPEKLSPWTLHLSIGALHKGRFDSFPSYLLCL